MVAVSASGDGIINTILSIRFISDIGAQNWFLIFHMLNVLSALSPSRKVDGALKKILEMKLDELTALANAEDTKGDEDESGRFGNRKLILRIAKQRDYDIIVLEV